MALQPQLRPGKDKRLSVIISFATELQSQLADACSHPPGQLVNDVQRSISSFPMFKTLGESIGSRCDELDSIGTALWNLCTRLRRNYDTDLSPQDMPIILVLARVFSFLLLDCALVIGKGTTSNVARVMKIGIKAAKNSLGKAYSTYDTALLTDCRQGTDRMCGESFGGCGRIRGSTQ